MAPSEASWATFMGQVGHGLRLAMAQLAPSKKKYKKKEKTLFFQMAAISHQIIQRRPKHFAFVAS